MLHKVASKTLRISVWEGDDLKEIQMCIELMANESETFYSIEIWDDEVTMHPLLPLTKGRADGFNTW